MIERGGERSDRVALRHPVWWAALALLVINDHVLKGADLVPAWLTGKLSDFAGLVVAPVLLSALLGSRGPRRRAFAFAAVGGWFAAANLFAPVAAATSTAAAWVGLSWTLWVDPTDLVALAALPLAWHVASADRALAPRAWGERLALGLGVAACVASPPPDPTWNTAAFLVNRTDEPIEVRVRWVEASVDCDAAEERFAELLPRDVFEAGTTFTVGAHETLPLDRSVVGGSAGDPGPPAGDAGTPSGPVHRGGCDVVILGAEGLPETVVYWSGLTERMIPDLVSDDEDEMAVEGGLDLRRAEDDDARLELDPGPRYRLSPPVDIYDGGAACRDYGSITGFDWSDLPPYVGRRVRLAEVRETVDGCVSVTIEDDGDERRAFVCVPPEDFPFLPNSRVEIWNVENELRIVRDLELDDGSTWRTGELVISRGPARFEEGPFDVSLVRVDAECQGVRMACGGFRVPAAGGLELDDGTRFVHPGDVVERDAADGRRARLRVGRAETMWVTHPACGAGRDVPGPRLEALVVYEEAPR
ncbi:MAG TPA: hypothetical protein RMH99_22195 [Sandaracinaceae bacterium LLY-WYZ-13_1]|nr:hypothetical protein [Sandaracinaceae bacterium LLY-WYZ-13_1]